MPQSDIKVIEKQYANERLLPDIIKMLEEGHTVTLKLRGISMRPFLEDNRDKALLAKMTTPRKGDVALAEVRPKVYVLHRIVSIKGSDVTLRGDGNLACEYCKVDNLKGFALGFYRKGRKKIDKTNGLKWKVYSLLWTTALPIRRYLLFIYRKANKL